MFRGEVISKIKKIHEVGLKDGDTILIIKSNLTQGDYQQKKEHE